MYQRLSADHDKNGNKRRVYVIMDPNGDIIKAIDEGCSGAPAECKGLVQLPEYYISVQEYKSLLKNFPE